MQEFQFNPREHLMTIKNQQGATDYLPVQWRLVWFRTQFPEGSIETEVVIIDMDRVVEAEQLVWNADTKRKDKVVKMGKGFACFKATVKTGQGGSASATGSESAVDFGDFIEKAETKAIGRALAGLGFGTQFAPELNEGQRLADAPVDFQNTAPNGSQAATRNPACNSEPGTINEQQKNGIRKLCDALGKEEPEGLATMSDQLARQLISRLSAEHRQLPRKAS